MKSINMIALILTVVGALNWGLIGLLNINIVSAIVGGSKGIENIIYILVGISALLVANRYKKDLMGGK